MKITKQITDYMPQFDIKKLGNPGEVIFIDIETTGLSPRSSYIYMIGATFYNEDDFSDENGYTIIQWMAENASEEKLILEDFAETISCYSVLVHFNGNSFDIPFITERCKANGIKLDLSAHAGIDIYRRITPFKHLLKLSSCTQKSIEEFLSVDRIDEYSGGELIKVYKEYQETKDNKALRLLIQHNYDDILGMLKILPILSYVDLFNGDGLSIKKIKINTYLDVNGNECKEMLINLDSESLIPVPVNINANGCFLYAKDYECQIKVPVYREEMKYFYEGYKDYYYLPQEDMAVHKSVSIYVDKEFRTQATASTCYTRKFGEYLPEWNAVINPFFKREYNSKLMFFEITNELKNNRELFTEYVLHLLIMFKENI